VYCSNEITIEFTLARDFIGVLTGCSTQTMATFLETDLPIDREKNLSQAITAFHLLLFRLVFKRILEGIGPSQEREKRKYI
jgi:hypothetical protein